jgi:hypothetical protein
MFALGRDPTKFTDSNKVETPKIPIVMQTRKGWGQAKSALTLLFLAELKIPSSQPRARGQSPLSPQPSLHAPEDETIEGSVPLRTLWLRPQGSVPIEEALTEIPPG